MLYPTSASPALLAAAFASPGPEYRGAPFWSWNCKLDQARLLRQAAWLAEMGLGGWHIHARTGLDTPYLGRDFLDCVRACVDYGRDHGGLRTWLYDEDRWPSGAAGGLLVGPLFFRTWDDVENDCFQLRTDATGIMGEAALKVPLFGFLTVVPMVGLGGLSQSFAIRERTGKLSLDSLLGAPGRTASVSPGMKLAGLAALELDLAVRTVSGRYGVALRGGYLYSPVGLTWRLSNGAEVTGTPKAHLGGPFFSVGLLILPEPQVTEVSR